MAMIDWSVRGVGFGNCNCAYGCPCQFEALPTFGNCQGFEVLRIDEGHFGKVRLDGLKVALTYAWPGPVFEGNGAMQAVVDERAGKDQRAALMKILYGEETVEGATHWWVYRAMCSRLHEPLVKSIQFEVDIEARTAQVRIPGLLESTGRPIRSPATGGEHRARIEIPGGIEFTLAEIGSATTKATGAIRLDLRDSYGQFNLVHHTGGGVVR